MVPHYSQRHASFFNQGTCLPGWKYTHELLSHVAPTLRRISLVARLEHHSGGLGALIEEWNTMDWDGIVESLKSFPDLERVEFVQQDVVPPSPTPRVTPLNDDLQTILLSRLPRLLDLGVLHFQPE